MTDFEARMGAIVMISDHVPVNRMMNCEDADQLMDDLLRSSEQRGDTKAFGKLSKKKRKRVLNEFKNILYYVCEGRPLPPLTLDGGHSSDSASAS
jgi:hypothetical protein